AVATSNSTRSISATNVFLLLVLMCLGYISFHFGDYLFLIFWYNKERGTGFDTLLYEFMSYRLVQYSTIVLFCSQLIVIRALCRLFSFQSNTTSCTKFHVMIVLLLARLAVLPMFSITDFGYTIYIFHIFTYLF
ncbi:hypothetical protein L9F63_020677, partial [Diploptera punctata]